MSAVIDAINSRWSLAASDSVVTNAELYDVYSAAKPDGVSLQALSAVDKIVGREHALLSVDTRIEKERWDKYDAASAALRAGEDKGLKPPALKPLREAMELARDARDKASDEQMKQFDVYEQSFKLSRMLHDDYDAQSVFDDIYANIAALRPFQLSFTP